MSCDMRRLTELRLMLPRGVHNDVQPVVRRRKLEEGEPAISRARRGDKRSASFQSHSKLSNADLIFWAAV